MSRFELKHIEKIKGRIDFYYLVMDKKNQFIEFEEAIKKDGSYDSELATLQNRMQEMSELKLLPKTKCRDITPKNEKTKEYELKTTNLRCYLFHEENRGRVVVMLTKKKPKTQKKDIKKFRSFKKQYLNR